MFDYKLALMTGIDIPIPEIQATIHQPTIKEISMIGEKDFFTGIQLSCINKNMYIEDESLLSDTTNFQIFMTVVKEKQLADKKDSVIQLLQLLFPSYNIVFSPQSLILMKDGQNIIIDQTNFEMLQTIVNDIFCLKHTDQQTFNPANQKAKEIADKLMRGRQRVAAQQQEQGGSMFTRYLSIIVVGLNSMSLQDALALTMFQLYDLIERYTAYTNWDLDIRSRLAGAKAEKPIENWMKQIH